MVLALFSTALAALRVTPGEELLEEKEGHSFLPERRRPTARLVEQLQLPEGFRIRVFAADLGAPRMLTVADDGTVYVTRRDPGDVLALRDRDGDGRAEEVKVVLKLENAHGITLHGGKLYVCTVRALYVAERQGDTFGEPRQLLDGLPPGGRHPNRTIAFGPDGQLYITVGSTCNCCIEKYPESASILRTKPDGSGRTIFAEGLRNTIGFGWHPKTREMWGMDHGTDWLGDNKPPEELNRLQEGKHYGWPFVYGDRNIINFTDPPEAINLKAFAAASTPSVLEYQAHSAPIQMTFYTGRQFPEEYRNDAFVAMHGSWNRKPPSGYEVVRIRYDGEGRPRRFERFLTGFLIDGGKAFFGRPAGVAVAADGALLVGDDANGVIYRVSYQGRPGESGR